MRVEQMASQADAFFHGAGYERVEPLPLRNGQDRSVLFTGSSTARFKGYLQGEAELAEARLFAIQPCLRTHNLKYYEVERQKEDALKHLSYFWMAGTFESGTITRELADRMKEFLCTGLSLEPERLAVVCSAQRPDLVAELQAAFGADLVRCTKKPEMTKWKYGIDSVSGEGVLLYYRVSSESGAGAYLQLGDLIEITRESTGQKFVEACFGLNLLSCLTGRHRSPLDSSPVAAVRREYRIAACFDADIWLDALMSALEMVRAGVSKPVWNRSRQQEHALKRYLKFVVVYGTEFVRSEQMPAIARTYYQAALDETEHQLITDFVEAFCSLYDWQLQLVRKLQRRFGAWMQREKQRTRAEYESCGIQQFGLLQKQLEQMLHFSELLS